MKIRPATAADLEALMRLAAELDPEAPPAQAPSPQAWAAWRPGTLVLEEAGAVAGYAVLVGFTLRHLVVAPGHRRRGYGRALLRAAFTRLREEGYPRVELVVRPENRAARALYEAEGLTVEAEEPGAGFPALRMSGPVPSPE